MTYKPFNYTITLRDGTWRERICRRRGHDTIVAVTPQLTMQGVCLRCRARGPIDGIEPMFHRTSERLP